MFTCSPKIRYYSKNNSSSGLSLWFHERVNSIIVRTNRINKFLKLHVNEIFCCQNTVDLWPQQTEPTLGAGNVTGCKTSTSQSSRLTPEQGSDCFIHTHTYTHTHVRRVYHLPYCYCLAIEVIWGCWRYLTVSAVTAAQSDLLCRRRWSRLCDSVRHFMLLSQVRRRRQSGRRPTGRRTGPRHRQEG